MTQWYVKDLSKKTGVSTQTLHHYDSIDLLKPSLRLHNGYRLYSDNDLFKLQQIIALKFFDFKLSQIKILLTNNIEAIKNFIEKSKILDEKAKNLMESSKALKSIISKLNLDQPIPWESIIKIIDKCRIVQEFKKTSTCKALIEDEINQYIDLETNLTFTLDDQKIFEQILSKLIVKVQLNLNQDPTSEFGINLGQEIINIINGLYTQKDTHVKYFMWKKWLEIQVYNDNFLDPKIVEWVFQAIDAYYKRCIYTLLEQVEENVAIDLSEKWNLLMYEMFGEDIDLKQEIIYSAQTDKRISKIAKKWLQQFSK